MGVVIGFGLLQVVVDFLAKAISSYLGVKSAAITTFAAGAVAGGAVTAVSLSCVQAFFGQSVEPDLKNNYNAPMPN